MVITGEFHLTSYFEKWGRSSGGPFNKIADTYHIFSIRNTISVNELQQRHEIYSGDHLLEEIDRHYNEECSCGLVCNATVEMQAKKLFESQEKPFAKEWLAKKGDSKWDYETCLEWVKIFMGENSFKGKKMEDEAIKQLSSHCWKYRFVPTDMETDSKFSVDILAIHKETEETVAGIQVKPESFYRMHLPYVKESNDAFAHPVHHLVYQGKDFNNMLSIVSKFL